MKATGIICEYNPFHNGHLYHLNEAKKLNPDSIIIAVMSGNFMQRGECAIINKWDRTKVALNQGADLVIELPFTFASQGADIFSKGSIEILKHLQADFLVFGSENNNLEHLKKLADIQLNNKDYNNLVKTYLKEGINFPTALSKALEALSTSTVTTPNDILGLSYIREIIKQEANITPLTVQRTNDYHSLEIDNNIVSASSIRKALKDGLEVSHTVPKITNKYLQDNLYFIDNYFSFLKYKIITSKDLSIYQTVDEGIEGRLKKEIIKARNLEDYIKAIKTKRYTYNKIRRMLTHILCDFTKEEAKENKDVNYIRVLGLNKKGQEYLNEIKHDLEVPLLTTFDKNLLQIELRVTSVYASILEEENKILEIEKEYKTKVIPQD